MRLNIHEAALNLLENISAPMQDAGNAEWFKDRIVIPKTACAPVEEKTWNGIVISIRENRVITFQYQSAVSENLNNLGKVSIEKLTARRVRPYQLLFDRSSWYLFAFDEDRNEMRMFALSRITGVTQTKETFTIPRDFDYRSMEGTSYFGIYSGTKTYRFTIAVTGDTRWIKERLWAEDQRIDETRSGIKLSFSSNQFEKVLEWILFQGPNARPLAPKALVERWTATIREMAQAAGVINAK